MYYDIDAFVASSSTEDMPPGLMPSFPADMSAASEQQAHQHIDELDAELIHLEKLINENQAEIMHVVQIQQKNRAMLCDLEQSVGHLQQEVQAVSAVFKPLLSSYSSSHQDRYIYHHTRQNYRQGSDSNCPRYSERVLTSVRSTVGCHWRSQSSFDASNRRSVLCMCDSSWPSSTDSDWSYHRRHVTYGTRPGSSPLACGTRGPRRHHRRGDYYRPRYVNRRPQYTTQRGHAESRVGGSHYSSLVRYH
jgi:hypothetical protein